MVGVIKKILRRSSLSKTNSIRKNWYKEELNVQISEKKRRELKKNGFLASADIVYDFNKFNKDLYVNRRDYHLLFPFSKNTSQLINNKAFISCLFSWKKKFLPEISVFIDVGKIVFCLGSKTNNDLRQTLKSLLDDHHELFAKKVNGTGGNDTLVITEVNLEEILSQLNFQKWLINNRIHNEKYSQDIFDESLNTLRVVFYKNSSGEMKCFRIFHRFGTSESNNVDNCAKGGMVCGVDQKTGKLSKAVIYGSRNRNGWYSCHVNSKKQLEGTTIPEWESKIGEINEIVQNLFFLEYGGIDIAPASNGLKILEINSLPNLLVTQMLEPALIDQEFAEFLERKGYKLPNNLNALF